MYLNRLTTLSQLLLQIDCCFEKTMSNQKKHAHAEGISNAGLYQGAHLIQRRDNSVVFEFYKHALNKKLAASGNAQVLEVGCGSGDTTSELIFPLMVDALKCKRIVATDISTEMVEFAKKNFAHEKVIYEIFDIRSSEATDKIFSKYGLSDYVFSFYTLHWVNDLRGAMANMRRLMKPAGQSECLLAFLSHNPSYFVYQRICEYPEWKKYFGPKDIPFGAPCTQEQLTKLAEENGITLRSCEILRMECQHPSMEVMKEGVVAVCPVHNLIPPNKIKEYERDLVAEYVRQCSGNLHFTYELAVLHGYSK